MNTETLERRWNELSQKKMNLDFRIDRSEEQLAELKQERAELKGQIKLIEELFQEAQEQHALSAANVSAVSGQPSAVDQDRLEAAEAKRQARKEKRASHNGVVPSGVGTGVEAAQEDMSRGAAREEEPI